MLIYDVILDVGSTGCQQRVSLYQGDDRFKMLRITMLQNGKVYSVPSDLNIRLCGVKPDDSMFTALCGVRGGSVYWLPGANATQTQGTLRCQIQLRDHSGAVLFSPEFAVDVTGTVPVPEFPQGASEESTFNEDVLSGLSASADGKTLLFYGEPVGAIPSVAVLPESAAQDTIAYCIGDGLYWFADDMWVRLTDDVLPEVVATLQADSHTHHNQSLLDNITQDIASHWDEAYLHSHGHDNYAVLNVITGAQTDAWNAAADAKHTHSNKSALDTVTAAKVTNWDGAAADRHTHTNKAALDTVTATKVANWDGAVSSSHRHANAAVLNQLQADVVNNSHTHANKSVLDAITEEKVSAWDTAVSGDGHTHANKAVLDTVTADVVSDSHTHANAAALDMITAAKVTDWDGAASDSHTHANKAVLDTVTADVVSDSHTHANAAALDTITAAKVTDWDGAASDSHTHANAAVLDTVTADVVSDSHTHDNKAVLDAITGTLMGTLQERMHRHSNKGELDQITQTNLLEWGYAYQNAHTHANASTLDTITAEKTAGWEEAVNAKHTHANKASLDAITGEHIVDWTQAAAYSHTHGNRTSLDKLLVKPTLREITMARTNNQLYDNGTVGIVTGFDTVVKSFAQYDAATDADAPLRAAWALTYDATAQMDDAVLIVEAGDEIGIGLIPVYPQGTADPTYGALEWMLTTDQNDPKAYMVFLSCESTEASDIFTDYGIEVGEEAEATAFFVYAFEEVTGDLRDAGGVIAQDVVFAQGWNVCFAVEADGNTDVTVAAVTDPNAYCTFTVFEQTRQAAPQHPFLYDVLQLQSAQDKRGVYVKTNGAWTPIYNSELQALRDRVTALENSVQGTSA